MPLPTLLIVEDEFLIADDLRAILEQAGYQVIGVAESVAEAKALIAQQTPMIVLLDVFLVGEQTGIDLAQWLSERDIPFVFLSANLTDNLLEAAKVTQPYGFLNKPFRDNDVLTTLEIARYRHAHSAEAKLRQQQSIQIGVNEAIISIHDRYQLCLAIAAQIDKLVPFSLLNLRIGFPGDASFYWVMLRKTSEGDFERVQFPALLRQQVLEELLEASNDETSPSPRNESGLFSGEGFEELCAHYQLARASRDSFGIQSLALFPVVLKQRSFTSIQLGCNEPEGFAPKDYAAVNLIIPQIALALDNLLATEEIEARRRLKTAELAVVGAFQSGKNIASTAAQVAAAINELMPIDQMFIHWVGQPASRSLVDAFVQKEGDLFAPLAKGQAKRPEEITPLEWQQEVAALEPWLIEPTLNVGEQQTEFWERNVVTRNYGKLLEIKSSMHVPIVIKGEAQASLIVASKVAFAFSAKDLSTLQELASHVALVLENMLAFKRIERLSEQLERENIYLTEEIKTTHNFEQIVGTSPVLLTVFHSIELVAATDYTVLVLGETGTGKELIARAVHNLSKRKNRVMVKVNCAALPAQLIESELFGHERGSYTGATDQRIGKFELAHGSTIFLDEIGELPLELQAKLLRVLQEGEIERLGGKGTIAVDVRIIAATNRNLQEEVAAGRFRADLYYRLNVFPILVPPLRERREDILPLSLHFLQKIGKKLGKPLTSLAQSAVQQMHLYDWPGNIRELEHVLERAAILSRTASLELAEPLLPTNAPAASSTTTAADTTQPLHDTVREAILAALQQANYRIRGQGGAAELLDIKATTLEARMKKMKIEPPKQLV
ncbi:sigma 54-interacting transcriptional regulator [Hymenobacter terricola]|uniref:sigma 54-interacting transcriptional regulator n=1 Tax=Hymenobacter terricola TaxID=2819236 RepID=UPI00293D5AF4|nr:sigma 54-interacting transcriptional regulator [Hymenobacter terricola]